MTVHAHWLGDGVGDNDEQGPDDMDMLFASDFPGAAEMQYSGAGSSWGIAEVEASAIQNDGYNLYGWTGENDDGEEYNALNVHGWMVAIGLDETPAEGFAASSSWNKRWWDSARKYWHEVHSSANVTFHMPTAIQQDNVVVERAYEQPVFMVQDDTHAFTFNFSSNANKSVADYVDMAGVENKGSLNTMITSFTQAASPADDVMKGKVPNSVFMGWIDAADLSDYEFNYVFDGLDLGNGVKAVNNLEHALPYLHTSADTDLLCRAPMDLYPVFTTFDLETTTNIADAGVDFSVYNIPEDPALANAGIEPNAGTVTVTYNDDRTLAGLTYNERGEANVTVTVDTDTPVWKQLPEGEANQPYTFVSLSVMENGEEVATIPADQMADGSIAYTIQAGRAYMFRANYSPVPVLVTYHHQYGSDGEESFSTEVGQVLPQPTRTPSFDDYQDDFVVGWVEGSAEGAPEGYVEGLNILTPGEDLVSGTMHLWPVYRSVGITVNSDIDDEAGEEHRGWTKAADGASIEVWAKPTVEAGGKTYRFQYWTIGGEDNASTAVSIALTGDDRFANTIYTAHYEEYQVNCIRYHDTQGNVIFTAEVDSNNDRAFVNTVTVQVPVLDDNGNLQYDDDGSLVTEPKEQTTPIDTGAFTAIEQHINAKNAAEGATAYRLRERG